MKPYSAVQVLLVRHPGEAKYAFGGSCFRLWSDNCFLTARHCVHGLAANNIAVLNCLAEDNTEDIALKCVTLFEHPVADIAIVQVEGNVPASFQKFKLANKDYDLGTCVHCFGILDEWMATHRPQDGPGRVVSGIIQRDFIWRDGPFVSGALEYSAPIPRGMSGGPAFYAHQSDTALGIALGTITSNVVVSEYRDYRDNTLHETEKICEVTRYGVILELFPLQEWLWKNLPK